MISVKLSSFVVFFTLVFWPSAVSLALRSCHSNGDCLANEYCYLNTHYCSPCLDCSQYGQHNPEGCARKRQDCGSCLPGFIEDTQNVFNNGKKICIMILEGQPTTTPKNITSGDVAENKIELYLIGVFVFILIIIIGFMVKYYYCKTRLDPVQPIVPEDNHDIRKHPTAPIMNEGYEYYNSDCERTLLPPKYSDTPPISGHRISDGLQETRPFSMPNYISAPQVSEETTDSPANISNSDMTGEDDTQPSPWTPSSSNGERTSFVGILDGNRNLRRHSNSEDVQEQDAPPPKQPNNMTDPTIVQLNLNNHIHIHNSSIQMQHQNNANVANVANMNRFQTTSETDATSNSEDYDENYSRMSNDRNRNRRVQD